MIFQDPLSSLNPIMKIGKQLTESMLLNEKISNNLPRHSRGFSIYGQSPRILAAPSQAHIRSAICVGIVTCYP